MCWNYSNTQYKPSWKWNAGYHATSNENILNGMSTYKFLKLGDMSKIDLSIQNVLSTLLKQTSRYLKISNLTSGI